MSLPFPNAIYFENINIPTIVLEPYHDEMYIALWYSSSWRLGHGPSRGRRPDPDEELSGQSE